MENKKYGDFNELLENSSKELCDIANAIKANIMNIDADSCEVVRLGDKAATFGIGPQKMKEGYLYIMPQKSWINLGFYQGALIDDKSGLLEGTGKMLRHIKVRTIELANSPELIDLVKIAINTKKGII